MRSHFVAGKILQSLATILHYHRSFSVDSEPVLDSVAFSL